MYCQLVQVGDMRRCEICGWTVKADGEKPRLLRRCSKSIPSRPPKPRGLGDRVESKLIEYGITKERVERWVGQPCNCAERREKLNALGEWATSAVERGKEWGLARLREIGAIQ